MAIDGRKEDIKMQILNKHRLSPASWEIPVFGTKNTRKIPDPFEIPAARAKEVRDLHFYYEELINEAFKKKIHEKYRGCSLLVAFDDVYIFNPKDFALMNVQRIEHPFNKIYLIGLRERVFKIY